MHTQGNTSCKGRHCTCIVFPLIIKHIWTFFYNIFCLCNCAMIKVWYHIYDIKRFLIEYVCKYTILS